MDVFLCMYNITSPVNGTMLSSLIQFEPYLLYYYANYTKKFKCREIQWLVEH